MVQVQSTWFPFIDRNPQTYVPNIFEATAEAMDELTTTFRYNDAVIRNLVIRRDEPVTDESFIMKAEKESRERKNRYEAVITVTAEDGHWKIIGLDLRNEQRIDRAAPGGAPAQPAGARPGS